MKESSNLRLIWLSFEDSSLYRANSGKAWVVGAGGVGRIRKLPNGDVLIPQGRPVALGLADVKGNSVPGQSDLIGYTTVIVTPDMVGHAIAVFTGVEVKESEGGRLSGDQEHFQTMVKKAGGIADVIDDPKKSKSIISDFRLRFLQRVL
jgi:hypothetical protein